MKSVLLVVDNRNWAYHTKANAIMSNYKSDKVRFHIVGYKDPGVELRDAFKKFDNYVFFGFQNFGKCARKFGADPKKALVSVASHMSWDNGATQPDNQVLPSERIIEYLRGFKAVSTVSKRLQNLFAQAGLKTAYTPNGVPTDMFTPKFDPAHSMKMVVGYAGRDRDDKKGHRTFIIPAVSKLPGVSLKMVLCDFKLERKEGTRGSTYRPYRKMPSFYQDIDIYICMSREEGSCRSVLEAMSCGCAIVSTDCGAIRELIKNGEGGYIVDRRERALVRVLKILKRDPDLLMQMKRRNREHIKKFDWTNVAPIWHRWIHKTVL